MEWVNRFLYRSVLGSKYMVSKLWERINTFICSGNTITKPEWWCLAGSVTVLMSLAYLILSVYFTYQAKEVVASLLPGVRIPPEAAPFKREFVAFGLLQSIYLCVLVFIWGSTLFSSRLLSIRVSSPFVFFSLICTFGAYWLIPDTVFRIFMVLATLFFIISFWTAWNQIRLGRRCVDIDVGAACSFHSTSYSIFWLNLFLCIISFVLCIILLIPGVKAWFPIILPNDYYEVPQIFKCNDTQGFTAIGRDDLFYYLATEYSKTSSKENSPNIYLVDNFGPRILDSLFFSYQLYSEACSEKYGDREKIVPFQILHNDQLIMDDLGDENPIGEAPSFWASYWQNASERLLKLSLMNKYRFSYKFYSFDKDNFKVMYADASRLLNKNQKISACRGNADWGNIIAQNSYWQAATGRLFFHHSLLYVPARHWLTYGFDNALLYLYGYGNTIFHAGMMTLAGDTLSAYFYTYPFALLVGLFCITICVGYCSRRRWLTLAAFCICLYELYSINFTGAFMAGGSFSPLRYAGLCSQIASVFFCFRGGAWRLALVPFVAAFSLFWNSEFGTIGLVCQGLIVFSPQLSVKRWIRAGVLLILCGIFLGYHVVFKPSPDVLVAIYTGMFHINLPIMSTIAMVRFFFQIFLAQSLVIMAIFTFKGKERAARLCVLPSIALIMVKPIFNPSDVHLAISLAFVLPLCLIFLPQSVPKLCLFQNNVTRITLKMIGIVLAAILCSHRGIKYVNQSQEFRSYFIDPCVIEPWGRLGEKIPTAVPQEPIADRIFAIQEIMQPDDMLLLLSPFDHLLSFYVNPPSYCGQFELLSNIVTKPIFEQVVDCVKRNSKILIVYDKKLLMPGLDLEKIGFPASNTDKDRLASKRNVARIFKRIFPDLVEVARKGDLIFYRKRSIPQEAVVPGEQADIPLEKK